MEACGWDYGDIGGSQNLCGYGFYKERQMDRGEVKKALRLARRCVKKKYKGC